MSDQGYEAVAVIAIMLLTMVLAFVGLTLWVRGDK